MMMFYRLVRLIESNSQALAATLLDRVQDSEATRGYKNVPPEELKERVFEIYRHLGNWLISKDERDMGARYLEIGARRALQHVPLSQLVWAIILTKENLFHFITKEATLERPVEVFGEMEMLECLDQFFDRAIYYAAMGYERAVAEHAFAQTSEVHQTC